MAYRVTLMAAAIFGFASFATAQTLSTALDKAEAQLKSSEDVRITLELRWLTVNDNFMERVRLDKSKKIQLPAMGDHSICDQETADLLLKWAKGDRRSNVIQAPIVTVASGGRHDVMQFTPAREVEGNDTILATVSNDRKAIDIQLDWAKQKDGKERLPVTSASVPLGLHLLVPAGENTVVIEETYYTSSWRELLGPLLHLKPKTSIRRESNPVFLLVTPRIAETPSVKATSVVR